MKTLYYTVKGMALLPTHAVIDYRSSEDKLDAYGISDIMIGHMMTYFMSNNQINKVKMHMSSDAFYIYDPETYIGCYVYGEYSDAVYETDRHVISTDEAKQLIQEEYLPECEKR